MKTRLTLIAAVLVAASTLAQDVPDHVVSAGTWTHKGRTFKVNKSARVKCWRYTHDGTQLLVVPFLSSGETTTRDKLVTVKDWAKCKKRLKLDDPKLTITPEQLEEIDRIDAEQQADNQ